MNAQLLYLAFLAQQKNDLNRKRRRFYYLMNEYTRHRNPRTVPHKIFTKRFVTKMYKQAQKDMKAMTPLMREVRKEAGARLEWSDGGHIISIETSEKRYYFNMYMHYGDKPAGKISDLVEMYHVDTILLGDK